MIFSSEWPQFYTATILNWQPLLSNDKYKDIIIESLQFSRRCWHIIHPLASIPAVVGISFTRSHPLQYHTDRRCWFTAKDLAERTNNNKCIPNYKRFSVFSRRCSHIIHPLASIAISYRPPLLVCSKGCSRAYQQQ